LRSEKSLATKKNKGTLIGATMNSIELFAGAGGLGLGVEQAGFNHSTVIERDHDACATIRFNLGRAREGHAQWPLHEMDVRNFDFSTFEDKVELVSGGPPC
jgi:DNA (cytosine-5)-methyltransferase 1